ncbi:MAG: DUF349 domain-containing protein [Pseudomonadota bacterium]
MFDRLLGPKINHADPTVRAKAYESDAVDIATVNDALSTERDIEVLSVVIQRADSISDILRHASEEGSLAAIARTRLVALAEKNTNADPQVWQGVFEQAASAAWTQWPDLSATLIPSDERVRLLHGALQSPSTLKALPEAQRLRLAMQSGSAPVRQLAADSLVERESIEQCCAQLKDKDKTVYRLLKEKLDAQKRAEALNHEVSVLNDACRSLGDSHVVAQNDAVAALQAKRQNLEQRIRAVGQENAAMGDSLRATFEECVAPVDAELKVARGHVDARKQCKQDLESLREMVESASATDEVDATALAQIVEQWGRIPDHTGLEQTQFDSASRALNGMITAHQSSRKLRDQLESRVAEWEKHQYDSSPASRKAQVEREWASAEKPESVSELDALAQRVTSVLTKLDQDEAEHARKRAHNSEQLLAILSTFEATVEAGEFKKAMSLNDKLRARSANRALEPAALQRIETALKAAQPKLDEYKKWRHFGTLQARENLIGQANTLISEPPASPKALAAAVKALRASWQDLDRDDGRASETHWQTFNQACKVAYKPAKKHFDQLAKERKANLSKRREIVSALEALLDQTDWQQPDWAAVTQSHKELTAQWRRAGTVDYKMRKEIDLAYERIGQKLEAQFKEEREAEITRRRRLIDGLKQSQNSDSGGKLASAAKRAQRDWRPTVQSDRKTEQALWEEFRSVCDDIFGSLKQQQKDAKAAWQAQAADRDALCGEIEALLNDTEAPEQGYTERDASVAQGALDAAQKRWRERHQIPKNVLAKLESRYRHAQKVARQRIRRVRVAQEQKAGVALDELLHLCQKGEAHLIDGNDETFSVDQSSVDGVRGPSGKALGKRFEALLALTESRDANAITRLSEARVANLAARRALCVRAELLAEIDSPTDAENERNALKLERLTQSMRGELPEPDREWSEILERWYGLGGVESKDWEALRERFSRAQIARAHIRQS